MLFSCGGGFDEAEEAFDIVKEQLQDNAEKSKPMHIVEDGLREKGREISRLLLQGYLKECGNGDIGKEVIDANCIRLSHKRLISRTINTIFGPVVLQRFGYSARGHSLLYPLDAILNLPSSSFSYPLQKILIREVAKGSFEDAIESVFDVSGVRISKQKAMELIQNASRDFDDFYESRTQSEGKAVSSLPLMVLTTDGKGVVMRPDGLREATRKRREGSENKHKTRLSRGEKGNAKRMAQVASIYHIDRFIRKPEDVYSESRRNRAKEQRPKPVAKRIWASIEKDAAVVIENLVSQAMKRDPKRTKEWVVLVDGQDHQIRQIESVLERNKIEAPIVLDIVHVIEYLWKAAHQFYDEGTLQCEQWVESKLKQVLESGGRKTAGSLRMSAAKRLSTAKQEVVEKSAAYLADRDKYTDYRSYLRKGYPIGTGVIEGACRYLVKDRMDITGARWGLTGAESVLRLRSILKSNDLDAYLKFYISQEYGRNHESRFAKPLKFIVKTS